MISVHSDNCFLPGAEGPTAGISGQLMPPFQILHDYLEDDLVSRLLAYVAENELKFEVSTIDADRVDRSHRISKWLRVSQEIKAILKERVLASVPRLIAELRVTPFKPSGVEFELVAHGDGAFYKRHIDTFTGNRPETSKQRLLSAVYYFNAKPKSYAGGELRLYAFRPSAAECDFVEIEPKHNTLVVFPSWAAHEVRPVSCPTKNFMASRFSINAWVLRNQLSRAR